MQHRQPSFAILIAFICAAIVSSGCVSSPLAPRLPVSKITSSLRESHPDGIPANAAQARMEQNGFHCKVVRDGTFVHKIRDPESAHVEPLKIQHIDFIECHRKIQSGWVTSYDTVALVLESDTVVDVLSNWEAVGP